MVRARGRGRHCRLDLDLVLSGRMHEHANLCPCDSPGTATGAVCVCVLEAPRPLPRLFCPRPRASYLRQGERLTPFRAVGQVPVGDGDLGVVAPRRDGHRHCSGGWLGLTVQTLLPRPPGLKSVSLVEPLIAILQDGTLGQFTSRDRFGRGEGRLCSRTPRRSVSAFRRGPLVTAPGLGPPKPLARSAHLSACFHGCCRSEQVPSALVSTTCVRPPVPAGEAVGNVRLAVPEQRHASGRSASRTARSAR